jgi:sec-independent protein translocase protein TatB
MVIMEIFGIGPLEFLLIIVLMLLVLGPEQMLATARKIGLFIRQLVRSPMWGDVMDTSREIRNLPTKIIQEAGLEEDIAQIKEAAAAPTQMINEAAKQLAVEIEPINLPKIDIKTATQTPSSSSVTQEKPVENKTIDAVPLSVYPPISEVNPANSAPLTAESISDTGTPLQVDFNPTEPDVPTPDTQSEPPKPLEVEIEPMPQDLLNGSTSSALQENPKETLDSAAAVHAEDQVGTPKRRTRRSKNTSAGKQDGNMTGDPAQSQDEPESQLHDTKKDEGFQETDKPKKTRTKRKSSQPGTELIAEALTPHTNGRANADES